MVICVLTDVYILIDGIIMAASAPKFTLFKRILIFPFPLFGLGTWGIYFGIKTERIPCDFILLLGCA